MRGQRAEVQGAAAATNFKIKNKMRNVIDVNALKGIRLKSNDILNIYLRQKSHP